MNGLEKLVRETLVSRTDEGAPDGAHLFEDVRERAARRRRRSLLAAGLAATATAGLVVGIAALVPADRDLGRSQAADPPPSAEPTEDVPSPPTNPIPADLQPVSFHGVEVLVPAFWKISDVHCGTPMRDTIIIDDGSPQPACGVGQPPGLTVVRMSPLDPPPGDASAALATEAVTVSGQPARRGTGKPAAGWQDELAVLVLPGPGVVVSVESPDPAFAGRLLDSTRIALVDSFGCRDRVDTLTAPPGGSRAGPAGLLVPGSPVAASVCRYDADRLERSAAVSPGELDRLVGILIALPVGTSTAGPGYFASPEICAEDTHRGFIVQFGYADRDPVDVYVQISGCADFSANNGARTTKIDSPLVSFLLSAVGYDGGFPNPSELQ